MKSQIRQPDICTHLLKVCERCQHDLLDPYGVTCLFDVDSGAFPAWRCNALGQIVEAIIDDICHSCPSKGLGGRLTVALHHKGNLWILAVRDQGLRSFKNDRLLEANPMLDTLAASFGGACQTRLMSDGALAVVTFYAESGAEEPEFQSSAETLPEPRGIDLDRTRSAPLITHQLH